MKKELIKGQCEHCGKDYEFSVELNGRIQCPQCLNFTENWDTVNGSQFAPFLLKICTK